MKYPSLLPENATEFERALEEATAFAEKMPVHIRHYWHPDKIPIHQSPWLAWEWSVDSWNAGWSDATKRNVIRDSFRYHSHKGTLASVVEAVESLGSHIAVREWWQLTPVGKPYTFNAVIDTGMGESSGVLQEQLIAAIDSAKPVRSHYTLTVAGRYSGALNIFGYARAGQFQRLDLTDG